MADINICLDQLLDARLVSIEQKQHINAEEMLRTSLFVGWLHYVTGTC